MEMRLIKLPLFTNSISLIYTSREIPLKCCVATCSEWVQCRFGRGIDLGLLVSASPPHAGVMEGTGLEERAGKEDRRRGIMRREEGRRGEGKGRGGMRTNGNHKGTCSGNKQFKF